MLDFVEGTFSLSLSLSSYFCFLLWDWRVNQMPNPSPPFGQYSRTSLIRNYRWVFYSSVWVVCTKAWKGNFRCNFARNSGHNLTRNEDLHSNYLHNGTRKFLLSKSVDGKCRRLQGKFAWNVQIAKLRRKLPFQAFVGLSWKAKIEWTFFPLLLNDILSSHKLGHTIQTYRGLILT